MRVAIDAREVCGRPTGVGRYLAGLLTAWANSDRARRHQWTLFAATPFEVEARWQASLTVVSGTGGTAWEQLKLPRALGRERPDVLFAPGYTAPLMAACPVVVTIHDVSFFAHPEWFSTREGLRRRLLTAWSARRARAVITDSEFSRSEITRFIGIEDRTVRVIPLGLSYDRLNDRLHDRKDPVVLYVGSIFERRRVDRLIDAFAEVARRVPGARLEIVGENRTRHPRIDLDARRLRSGVAERITIRSYVDHATLAQLYRDASVFVFLSEYEGFGLTPLEALVAGVPPVVLDTAVARETCAGAARYVASEATNPQIADAIVDLWTSAPARSALLSQADGVLSRYRWDRAAAETLTVLEEAAVGR